MKRNDSLKYGNEWISDDIESVFESANDIIQTFENKHHLTSN